MRLNLQICQLVICSLWSAAAWAGAFGAGLMSIAPGSIFIASVLAITGGAAGTLARAKAENRIPTFREIGFDSIVSVVAGLVTFFLCEWQAWPAPLQAALITIAGFGGAKILDRFLARASNEIDNRGKAPP